MKRHYKPSAGQQTLVEITPESAFWKYLSFRVLALKPGEKIKGQSADDEIVFVPLGGSGSVSFGESRHTLTRRDLFKDLPDIIYLPPKTAYRIEANEAFEVAIGGAPAKGKKPARSIKKKDIRTSIRGDANVKRGVTTLLDGDEYSERVTVYEIHTPSGNWSSFPPHRHDTRDGSSYHEETYYYRLRPADGFAIQRIYTRDTDLDVAIPIGNGDLVLIHEGYHPVVKAPGTNSYYLNFLAGDVRKINAVNDPHYDWVTKDWSGQGIEIPLKKAG
jgi:5-deoxy-glucuronate isomerase